MEISNLIKIKCWQSLGASFPEARLVRDNLYNIFPSIYAVTQVYDRTFKKGVPGSPFITMLLWTLNDDLAVKYHEKNVGGVCINHVDVPKELCYDTTGSYCDLIKILNLNNGNVAESAVYSPKYDGKFVHKVIETKEFVYCFLSQNIEGDELPYAIKIILK